ncbi:amidase [Cupriavidus plantarum]|nr:amidase [Cupriavidus plantarum]
MSPEVVSDPTPPRVIASHAPTSGCWLPAHVAAARLADGETTAVALTEACYAAWAARNPAVNAMVLADFDAARQAAAESDARRQAGRARGLLDGVPFSIKESFDVEGWPTTCGAPARADHRAAGDAAVVERLRAQGAVLLGKTNVPLGLRDWQSYNAIYGTTRNPHDLARTPGGSSGGSAAAVCAGMSYFDIGSDIGSSLRNPAHYCGVFSHKSSHGIVPLRGHGNAPAGFAGQDINVAGPIARSARDLELVLHAIAGPDSAEAPAWRMELPACGHTRLADFRVAVLPTHPLAEADAAVSGAIETLGQDLARAGARVRWNVRPDFDAAHLWHVYVLLLRATTSLYMDDAAFADALARAHGNDRNVGNDRNDSADSMPGDYATLQFAGATLSHRQWLLLQQAREGFARAWHRFFGEYDVLLCPAASTTAFPIDERGEPWQRTITVNGQPLPLTSQLFWAGHSGLCGLPSTVAPIGPASDGLPVGVQIVARRYGDLTSLRFAQLLEDAGHAFRPPPA